MTERPDPTRVIREDRMTPMSKFDCPRCGAADALLDRLHACPLGGLRGNEADFVIIDDPLPQPMRPWRQRHNRWIIRRWWRDQPSR